MVVKKYVFNLVLLCIVHNMCAMELDPFDRCIKYDKKCQLVAKYLYKYPKGENEKEAKEIEWFLKDEISERVTVLPWLVKKYKNILAAQDAQIYLDNICTYKEIHTDNPHWDKKINNEQDSQEVRYISEDLRQKIFAQALWYSAQEYYVALNSLKFLKIYQPAVYSRYSPIAIEKFYKPYFLAEINKKDVYMHFSNLEYNLPKDTMFYSTASLFNTVGQSIYNFPVVYQCKIKFIRELISFLDKRDERVHNFHIMFNNYIEQLSQMNEKDVVKGFIRLLECFNGLTQGIIYVYTGRYRLT